MYVILYLAAIVVANLTLATLGPAAAIPVGFVLIGLDLSTRDKLHTRWARRGLVLRMGALIAAGGALSWLLNHDAGRVAVASVAAFTVAALLDTLVFGLLADRSPRFRAITSNVPAALADSWLFLALAFPGPAPLAIVAVQWLAKSIGGAVWALILFPATDGDTLEAAIMRDLEGTR